MSDAMQPRNQFTEKTKTTITNQYTKHPAEEQQAEDGQKNITNTHSDTDLQYYQTGKKVKYRVITQTGLKNINRVIIQNTYQEQEVNQQQKQTKQHVKRKWITSQKSCQDEAKEEEDHEHDQSQNTKYQKENSRY